jgi:predicted RND superfamily exporter protein
VVDRLLALPQRFPRTTLTLVAALTALFSVFASRFQVDSAVDQLLPEHDPGGAYYAGVRETFGNEEIAVIGVFGDDVFAPATLARIDRLSRRLAALDGVQQVTSLTTLENVIVGDDGLGRRRLMPPLPLTDAKAAEFRARVHADRLAERALVSADGRAAGIWVRFKPLSDETFLADDLEGQLRAAIAAEPGPESVAITGLPTIKVQAARKMLADIYLFVPLALGLVTVMVIWAFRTWRGVLLPVATVVIGVTWTIGIMVLAGDAFTMGTLVLTPLLMAAGVAYAIHIVSRYYMEVLEHRRHEEAVAAAIAHVRLPVAMAALTTLIGFGTFVTSPIPSIRDFGIYAALGVAVIFIACVVVIPAVLVLLPAPKSVPDGLEEGGWFANFVEACGKLSIRHRYIVLPFFGLLIALGAVGMTKLRVETDYLRFFSPDNPVRVENARIGEALAGTQVIAVVIDGATPERVTRLDVMEGLRALQQFLAAQPLVDKTISVLDHLDAVRDALAPGRGGTPFAAQEEVDQLLLLLGPGDIRHELSADQARANFTVQTRLSGSREVTDFVARVEAWGREHLPADVQLHGTGTVVLLDRSADALSRSQIIGDLQVCAILLALMILLFRSLGLGLLSMAPNVFPVAMLFGLMGWTGIELNLCTATIASISLGIAVDDTIHYMLGYYEALRSGKSREAAILSTLRAVGRPILIIAVSLCAGFLIACFSNFQPVRHFGLLASVTMLVGVMTDLFLLPALLITLHVGVPARTEARAAAGLAAQTADAPQP